MSKKFNNNKKALASTIIDEEGGLCLVGMCAVAAQKSIDEIFVHLMNRAAQMTRERRLLAGLSKELTYRSVIYSKSYIARLKSKIFRAVVVKRKTK